MNIHKYFLYTPNIASNSLNIFIILFLFGCGNSSQEKNSSRSELKHHGSGSIYVNGHINQLDDQNFITDPYKFYGPGIYGGTGKKFLTISEMPEGMQYRYYELYAARTRDFTPLDKEIESFSIEKLSIPEAVAKLSNEHNVLCGIEAINWKNDFSDSKPFYPEKFSISFEKESPRSILDKLVLLDPNFAWFEENGFANIVMLKALENSNYPFNISIKNYEIKEMPYTYLFMGYGSLRSAPEIKGQLPFGGSLRWEPEFAPKISIKASDSTARQILNAVGKNIGMSWSAVLCSGPMPWISFQMLPKITARPCPPNQ